MTSVEFGTAPRGAATKDRVANLTAGTDAIEVKATIPDHQIEAALARYGLTVDNDEERYVYFFDTPALDLFQAGIIARARRIVGDAHDSTVKFRPVVPAEVPADWKRLEGFKLEADASEKGVVKSASLTLPVRKGLIKKVVAGAKPIEALFTEEQESFLEALGGRRIDFEALSIFGPLQAHRWRFEDPASPWPITAELWKREDGDRLMEVSIKSPVAQAAVAVAGFMALLAEVGVEQDLEQQTKTRWALTRRGGDAATAQAAAPAQTAPQIEHPSPQGAATDLGAVIPRWEWRTFGGDLAEARSRLQALGSTGSQDSDEVYLVSALGDANVKIRAGLLDLKRLEQTNGDGLEQWRPVLKAELPIAAATVIQVFEALGLPAPQLQRTHYSLEQLSVELIRPEPRLRDLQVHKERMRYRMRECACEVTEVVAAGRWVTTLAVESEDAAAVAQTVRELGLWGRPNQSYPRGLKALIDWAGEGQGPRFAVIDLGTNSVKLHVGERNPAGHWTRVLDRSEVTRLGEGLAETGIISPAARARTLAAIRDMADEARGLGAEQVVAVGTMGMRNAANSDAFIREVQDACGLSIEVIGGDEEARLAFLAVQESLGIPGGSVVVFDTGGGSTQITLGRDGAILDRFSLNLGAARLTEDFGLAGPVPRETLAAARAAIAVELARLDSVERPDALVGMGGAVTNLTAVSLGLSAYDPDRIQGATLSRAEVERQIDRYAALDAAGRRAIPGLQPGRAEVILAGALVVITLMDKLGQEQLSVSDRGLRHGVLLERFRAN
ncbi:MAG: hypothetical protein ACM3ST_01920 [Bdellovibrio bacteriovorus]